MEGLVLISDIHFSINTLKEASASLEQAFSTAQKLRYPLVIAGDLNDTKAIIRAEVANRLIQIFKQYQDVETIVLIGNHDLINEKGAEHSLNFLREFNKVIIVDAPIVKNTFHGVYFIPYQTSKNVFIAAIAEIPKGSTVICHQGFLGAFMGEYVQDTSSVDPSLFSDYQIYSGHYHRHQNLGSVTYIGTPYTTTFAESEDGPKGFLVIDPSGRMNQVKTNLRKHTIVCRNHTNINIAEHGIKLNDLLWLKISGTNEWLKTLDREELGKRFIGHSNYRLDLISTEDHKPIERSDIYTPNQLLDELIEQRSTKEQLKLVIQDLFI